VSKGLPIFLVWLLLTQALHLSAVPALIIAIPFGWTIISALWLTTYFRDDGAAPWDLALSTTMFDLAPVEARVYEPKIKQSAHPADDGAEIW
jgi:hypothetical protein